MIHTSDMSMNQKCLTNQVAADEIIIKKDAILSHTLTFFAYIRRSKLTKFEAFW